MSTKGLTGWSVCVIVAMGWLAPAAQAAQATDCAPVGHLPTYTPGERQTRAYDKYDFTVGTADDSKTMTVAGAKCEQDYTPKDDTDALSDLEIQSNYRDQLTKLGAQIVFSQETEIDVHVVDKGTLVDTLTAPSGADYRLLGHMPGYAADTPTKRNFDKADFTVQNGDDTSTVTVEGALYDVNYSSGPGAPASDLAIQQNYRDALNTLGAQILFADGRDTTARLENAGKTIWIKVYSQETGVEVTAVEEKAFAASITPPTADALKTALDKDGRIALYVNFDFNKATLKPDAKPVIDQVVALMKNNPALKLEIDGYTDNVGAHDYNVKLSQDRAAAVVAALKTAGVDASRLTSNGFGPDKPIADEATAEGRAKNRRVELVKR
jgi:outer membrane protein OmpA-like peptidoglycan-associated protein